MKKSLKLTYIIAALVLVLVRGSYNSSSTSQALAKEQVMAEPEHKAEGHQEALGDSEHEPGGEHQQKHHIWWTFPGYEIFLGVLGCLYFALVIIIVPFFIGKDLGSHDPLEEHH